MRADVCCEPFSAISIMPISFVKGSLGDESNTKAHSIALRMIDLTFAQCIYPSVVITMTFVLTLNTCGMLFVLGTLLSLPEQTLTLI